MNSNFYLFNKQIYDNGTLHNMWTFVDENVLFVSSDDSEKKIKVLYAFWECIINKFQRGYSEFHSRNKCTFNDIALKASTIMHNTHTHNTISVVCQGDKQNEVIRHSDTDIKISYINGQLVASFLETEKMDAILLNRYTKKEESNNLINNIVENLLINIPSLFIETKNIIINNYFIFEKDISTMQKLANFGFKKYTNTENTTVNKFELTSCKNEDGSWKNVSCVANITVNGVTAEYEGELEFKDFPDLNDLSLNSYEELFYFRIAANQSIYTTVGQLLCDIDNRGRCLVIPVHKK